MDHDLAYRALASGGADVTDVYTTDPEIHAYKLRVLEDDRHFFPTYEALLLYRADLADARAGGRRRRSSASKARSTTRR